VHGPVAADDDEQARAVVGRLASELSELARPLRKDRLAAEAGRVGRLRDLRPAFSGLPVRRRRVDE
jgi:hypothetical protein